MLSLFRKKPTFDSVSRRAADIIEQAITAGYYFNQGNHLDAAGNQWMCICLYDMQRDKLITQTERDVVERVILRRLKGRKTLRGYLYSRGVEFIDMCDFEYRITLSNFWWQFIRELRNQPQLGASNA